VVDKPAKAEEHDHHHGHAHQNRPARSTPGLSPWVFRLFVQAQVVSIDDDPNAPASATNPRTWTFLTGAGNSIAADNDPKPVQDPASA
jgi:hypothetical protein